MAAQITNYQCPSCAAPLQYSGNSGKLKCDYCSSEFNVATIEQLYADKERAAAYEPPEWNTATAGGAWNDEETANLRAYTCPSCGAELICEHTTAATSCPYCGNRTVVPGQLAGALRPDGIIPFKLDKNEAIAALKQYYRGKKFLPDNFSAANHIEEIKGIYVPFWLFNCEADANLVYHGTRVETHTHGNERITTTDHYRISRDGRIAFENVPVDGSKKMPDEHMDSVEPFDYRGLKQFSTAYLPGFFADKYDIDAKTSVKRANERILESTQSAFRRTISGYTNVTNEHTNIHLRQGQVKYVLLPVWILSTKWRKKSFLFAMNAQTGKLIGDLPVDPGKFLTWFAGISLPLMALLSFILLYF